jgi:hypothetical protein
MRVLAARVTSLMGMGLLTSYRIIHVIIFYGELKDYESVSIFSGFDL